MAFLILLPHLLWQVRLGWPTVELLRNAKLYQHQPVSPAEFIWGQIQLVHPFTLPIWVAGVYFYLRTGDGKPYRFLGWAFVLLFAAALLGEAKTYYLAPMYPTVLAAGAVATERLANRRRWNWLKPVTLVFLLIGGVMLAPYVLPVLPIEAVPRYLAILGMKEVRPERRAEGVIPQLFADMFAWPETVAAVARAYHSLVARGSGAVRHLGTRLRRGRGGRLLRRSIRPAAGDQRLSELLPVGSGQLLRRRRRHRQHRP